METEELGSQGTFRKQEGCIIVIAIHNLNNLVILPFPPNPHPLNTLCTLYGCEIFSLFLSIPNDIALISVCCLSSNQKYYAKAS